MTELGYIIRKLKKRKILLWFVIIYGLAIIVFMLPKIPGTFRYVIQDYREAFFGAKPSGRTEPADLADIHRKLSALEVDLASLKPGSQTDKIATIEKELSDLKKTIFGDPEKALSVQRLNIEFANLKDQIAGLQSQNRWLFGITLTIALSVLTAFIGFIRSVGSGKKGSEKSNN